MYQYPYGNAQQLNLDWLMEQWQEVKQSIDGSLQGEIDRVEAAITDLLAARDAAVAAAGAANTSAGAAAQSAQAAAADAATASAQAAAAATARSNAAQAANNAQQYAGNAQTQAAAAQNAAGQAAASASQAAADASDAHDDAVAASGSAVNAAASAAGALQNFQLSDAARQAAQAAEQDAEAAATLLQPPATSADIGKALIVKTVGGGTVTAYELGDNTPAIVQSIEDVPVASFDDGTGNPVLQLVVDIEPVQSGSGDPAPDNVRPITGWTVANVYKSGADTSNPTILPITFPTSAGTVYGGTLNVTRGVLTVEKIKHIVNGTEAQVANQTMNNDVYRTGIRVAEFVPNATGDDAVDIMCNIGRGSSRILGGAATVGDCCLFTVSDIACVLIGVPIAYNTVSAAKQWLLDQHCEFVAKLATPLTYQLTPTEVSSLLGTNNIWADTGNINLLQYYADSKKYIDEQDTLIKALIAPVLDEMVADTALTANDFRIVDNTLYKITTSVAAGATLTPNTNCTATTIGAVLKTLLT